MATAEELKAIADKHLAGYMEEIKQKGIDPEKAVHALFLSTVIELEHKHGRENARRVFNDFIDEVFSVEK